MTTVAFRLHQLRQEIDPVAPEQDYSDAIVFLDGHAYDWARNHQGMSYLDARRYASWYVEEFGDVWADEYDAPLHSHAHKAYILERVK